MHPDILADLIISFVLVCFGAGLVVFGLKIKKRPATESKLSSPTTFIAIGILMVVVQMIELVKTYV